MSRVRFIQLLRGTTVPCRYTDVGVISATLAGHPVQSVVVQGDRSEPVTLGVLGDVAVFGGSGAEVSVSPQRLHLLAALAAVPGQVVHRGALLDAIWGEDTTGARNSLKTEVSAVRRVLGGGGLSVEFRRDGYRLCGSLEGLDSTRFEAKFTSARNSAPADAARLYCEALALWRGPSSFSGLDMLLIDDGRRRLDALRVETELALGRCELALQRPDASLGPLQRLFRDEPDHSEVALLLAALLAVGGRQTQSLDVLAQHRRSLVERGLSVSAEVEEQEGRILRHQFGTPQLTVHANDDPIPSLPDVLARPELEDTILDALQRGPVLVLGEAGVGKTILTRLVAARLGLEHPVWVRATPEPERALEAIAGIVEQLEQRRPGEFASLLDATSQAAVDRLLMRAGSGQVPKSKEWLVDTMSDLLELVLRDLELVVVEDADHLDHGSVEIFGQLIARGAPRLLITSRRAPKFPSVEALTVIDVPTFTHDEVSRIAHAALPVRATGELVGRLHRETGGNALFLRLWLELLAEGTLGRALPMSIRHAVHERTSAFSQHTRTALQLAALLGQTFPLAPLRRVHPNFDQHLSDAIDERLVRLSADGTTGEFVHGLVVEALNSLLLPAHRLDRHDELCDALIECGAAPIPIAVQAVGAQVLDPLRACSCCLAAAEQQAALFEWALAVDWAKRGLDAAQNYAVDEPSLEARLRLVLGKALRRDQQPGSDVELAAAAHIAFATGASELLVSAVTELCLHGATTRSGSVDVEAATLMRYALSVDVEPALRAVLLSAAPTLLAVSDQVQLGRTLFREAVRMAEECDDRDVARSVWMNANLGLVHPEDLQLRRTAAVELARFDDEEAIWESQYLRFGLSLVDGDREALDQSVAQLRDLTLRVRWRSHKRGMDQVDAVHAFIRGDLEQAERSTEEVLVTNLRVYSSSWAISIYLALLLPVREAQGRLQELQPHVTALLRLSPDFITWHAVAALTAHARNDRVVMRQELDHLAEHHFAFVEDFTWTAVAALTCRTILTLDDGDAARALYPRLLPYSGQMTWNGLSTHGPVDAGLACLASVMGDTDAARDHMRVAANLVARFGVPHLSWPQLRDLL